jgi:probable DNA metabolism protein
MKILTYNSKSNIDAFLTAVYHCYYEHNDAEKIIPSCLAKNFIDEYIDTQEDILLADKVKNGIIKKGGRSVFDDVSLAYRSGNSDKDIIILNYLRLLFKYGRAALEMFDDPSVADFNGIVRKVGYEICRLSAFVRLQEMSNGIYYGYFSSDNDILEYLAPEYLSRFNTMKFILHDYKRKKMAYCADGKILYADAPDQVGIELSDREAAFRSLWQQYHHNAAIQERANPKLQQKFAPKKYRHFMNEFK